MFHKRMQNVSAYNDRKVRIADAEKPIEIEFEWPIAQMIPMGSIAVVRTEPKPGALENRNVFAVDEGGKIIWRVAQRAQVYADSPYTELSMENGLLVMSNWGGLTLTIKPFTWEEVAVHYGR